MSILWHPPVIWLQKKGQKTRKNPKKALNVDSLETQKGVLDPQGTPKLNVDSLEVLSTY
jgi:hypothetical protein